MTFDPVLLALPFFGLTMTVEWWMLRTRTDLKGIDYIDAAGSLTQGIGYLATNTFWRIPVLAALTWLSQFALFDIPTNWWLSLIHI